MRHAADRNGRFAQAALLGSVLEVGGAEWRSCEAGLLRSGHPVPFAARVAASADASAPHTRLIAIRDGMGLAQGAVVVESRELRLLPSHRTLHIDHFGSSFRADAAADPAIDSLCSLLREDPHVVRATVRVFSPESRRRRVLGDVLRQHGFTPAHAPSSYTHTLVVDLRVGEEALFRQLHYSARRKLRAASRHPAEVRPITDTALAPRLREISRLTMRRTGGRYEDRDWESRIRLAQSRPDLARLVGMFRTDRDDSAALAAFAWGCHHGDHGSYTEGGSCRPADLRIPLMYALIWDLLLWSRRHGATWFDMGGVTRGRHGGADPLGGISDFKRYFGGRLCDVAEDWVLYGPTKRARLAATLHGWMARARRGGTPAAA